MLDPRISQFTFNLASVSPSPAGRLPSVSNEKIDAVYESLYQTFARTDFLEKSKFRKLHLIFWLVPDHYVENEITFEHNKRGVLTVKKNLHQSSAHQEIEQNYVQFMLSHGTSMLEEVCRKLGIDGLGKPPIADQIAPPKEEDELQLHIKLSDHEMGDMDQFVANTNIMELADQILRNANLGRFDASEIGSGFETMFFVGLDAQQMLNALESVTTKLPYGSYAELVNSQGSKHIDL